MSTSSNSSNNHHCTAKRQNTRRNAYIDTLLLIREGVIVSRYDIPATVQGVARRRAEALLEGITFYGLDAFWEMCNTLYYSYHWQHGWQDLRTLSTPGSPQPFPEPLEEPEIDQSVQDYEDHILVPVKELGLLIKAHRALCQADLSSVLGNMERCAVVKEVIMNHERELCFSVEVSTHYSIPKASPYEPDDDLPY